MKAMQTAGPRVLCANERRGDSSLLLPGGHDGLPRLRRWSEQGLTQANGRQPAGRATELPGRSDSPRERESRWRRGRGLCWLGPWFYRKKRGAATGAPPGPPALPTGQMSLSTPAEAVDAEHSLHSKEAGLLGETVTSELGKRSVVPESKEYSGNSVAQSNGPKAALRSSRCQIRRYVSTKLDTAP